MRLANNGTQFKQLWWCYVVTSVGSGLAMGLATVIALQYLKVSTGELAVMLASATVVGGIVGSQVIPLLQAYSPVRALFFCEVVQALALVALLSLIVVDSLSFIALAACYVVQVACAIIYLSFFNLVVRLSFEGGELLRANSRIESVMWVTQFLGPVIGGVITGWRGPAWVVSVELVFVGVAAAILGRLSLRASPSLRPNDDGKDAGGKARSSGGLALIARSRLLLPLFVNALVLGAGLAMSAPLIAGFMLQSVAVPPWQYGLVLGLPAAMGLLGALSSEWLAMRCGTRSVFVLAGATRGAALASLSISVVSPHATLAILASQSLLMVSAGVFNPIFSSVRQESVRARDLPRVTGTWSACAKVVQPLGVAAGGALAATWGIESALYALGVVGLVSMLPMVQVWRAGIPASMHRGSPR